MPLFRYEAVDSTGAKVSAYMQVADERAVADKLTQMGYQPTSIELTQRSFQQTASKSARTGPPATTVEGSKLTANKRTLARLYHQLHVSLRSGMAPFQAFTTVAGQLSEPAVRQALHEMSAGVRDGGRISDLMERHPRMFSRGDVGMIRAAETAGFLPEAFGYLARQHEEDDNTARKLTIWLWFFHSNVLTLPLIIPVAFFLMYALPALDPMAGLKPAGLSFLFGSLPMIVGYYGGLAWFHRARHNPKFAARWHQTLLKLPMVGPIARLRSMAVFTRTLQLVYHAGVPADTAWETASAAVPNLCLADQFARGLETVRGTYHFSHGMSSVQLFDPADVGMVATGERSGNIEEPLAVLADRYEEETRIALGASVVRGAMMLVFWALAVGGIAMIVLMGGYFNGILGLIGTID